MKELTLTLIIDLANDVRYFCFKHDGKTFNILANHRLQVPFISAILDTEAIDNLIQFLTKCKNNQAEEKS